MRSRRVLAVLFLIPAFVLSFSGEPSALAPGPESLPGAELEYRVGSGIRVEAQVSHVEVYLDSKKLDGYTPIVNTDVAPGEYRLSLKKVGYRDLSFQVRIYEGLVLRVMAKLTPITGSLDIELKLADTAAISSEAAIASEATVSGPKPELYIDGKAANPGLSSLSPGEHLVQARCFGYEGFETRVEVPVDGLVALVISLKPIPFALTGIRVEGGAFSPRNHGALGRARVFVGATGPGSFQVLIKDASGTELIRKEYSAVDWESLVEWDGRDQSGRILPDGLYELSAGPFFASIRVDSSLDKSALSLGSGSPGLEFCPLPLSIAPGGGQVGMSIDLIAADSGFAFSPCVDVRLGIVPGLELDLGSALVLGKSPIFKVWLGAQWLFVGFDSLEGFKLGLNAGFAWSGTDTLSINGAFSADSSGRGPLPGIRLGLVGGYRIASFAFSLAPSCSLLLNGSWGYSGFESDIAAGLRVELGECSLGFSGKLAFASLVNQPGFSLAWPICLGVELGFYPTDRLYVHASFGIGIDQSGSLSKLYFGLYSGFLL